LTSAERHENHHAKAVQAHEDAQLGASMRNFVVTGTVNPPANDSTVNSADNQNEMDISVEQQSEQQETMPERVELNIPNVRGERFGDFFTDETFATEDDDDDYSGGGDKNDDAEIEVDAKSPMQVCLWKVCERLQEETRKDMPAFYNYWLTSFLKNNGWVIQDCQAKYICRKLGIEYSEPAYYQKIIVWLPDVQFGCNIPCPNDECDNDSCKFHAWRDDHIARRVTDLYGHYYIMSRRYKCNSCEKHAAAIKKAEEEQNQQDEETNTADADGARQNEKSAPEYTFMGYNEKTLQLLPDGLGDKFPAYLTHKAGVDMSLIDLMRPLLQFGVKAKQFRDLLQELARKKHSRDWLERENKIARIERTSPDFAPQNKTMFGAFDDKSTYDGHVPSTQYLASVYKKYSKDIRFYLLRELKKRPAKWLRWDVSYKEAKKLCRYKGSAIFKGLVTACNELGEVRLQFHVVTDSHEQMMNALAAYRETIMLLGQEMPEIVFTDNPASDYYFFCEQLPSLVEHEKQINNKHSTIVEFARSGVPKCQIEPQDIFYADTPAKMNEAVNLLRNHLKDNPDCSRVLGLDEEHEYGSRLQYPPSGRGRVALVQIGYEIVPGKTKALLLKLSVLPKNSPLPDSLLQLFKDPEFSYAGVKVKNDIERITEDFKCPDLQRTMQHIELGPMAKDRGVVDDAGVGLRKLTLLMLNEEMSKDNDVRSSKWANKILTDCQKSYSAIDATKSLEVYLALAKMKCYSTRLKSHEATQGVKVNIITPHGRVGAMGMGTVQAIGTIQEQEAWDPPTTMRRIRSRGPLRETRVVPPGCRDSSGCCPRKSKPSWISSGSTLTRAIGACAS